eukprot:TRINITY_DN1773_c0_g4_i1.p1 TRINITY_DN1773_c0_g4~~TRINITY_DN1773_c0_g4_i1.p1  ORF type:complete len:520 (+),score=67.75 TRINITY_DN1773_c0_g4_i1:66-1562(+)
MVLDFCEADKKAFIDHFRCFDLAGNGLIARSTLASVLEHVGCDNVTHLLDQWSRKNIFGDREVEEVHYIDFLEWLIGSALVDRTPSKDYVSHDLSLTISTSGSDQLKLGSLPEIQEAADALVDIASRLSNSDPVSASGIMKHVASMLRAVGCSDDITLSRPPSAVSSASSVRAMRRSNAHSFRAEAATTVQESACEGEFIDDLVEVSVSDLKHPSALSIWRPCDGLRLYRSNIVKKALRLICSAPVPGLGGTSYLDVFNSLTSSGWEHHVFLFGGLVRDILRRKVGNDIDITFSAPAAELADICQKRGYSYKLEGDYILIGSDVGEEYLEGMVITHNGITGPENSDFSMNWVFYDFRNDVIIDKTGSAVPAIQANRCEIPCKRHKWDVWIGKSESRLCFRYYKFLSRGFAYDSEEMAYIAAKLLQFWKKDPEAVIANGKEVLSSLITSQDVSKVELLRTLVLTSFDSAMKSQWAPGPECAFQTASEWWQSGWLQQIFV